MTSVEIKPSKAKNKKFTAIFYDDQGKKIKTIQFGDSRYQDYTMHKDKQRRDKYRARHQKSLAKTDYMSPAHLSYYILWGESSSLNTNINNYVKKFKLKLKK